MKRLLTFLLLSIAVLAEAQVQITPDSNLVFANPDLLETVAHGKVKNLTNTTKKYRWERVEECLADNWESAICDNKYCYAAAIAQSPAPFILAPFEEGILDIHVRPNGVDGGAHVKLRVYEDGNESMEDFTYVIFNFDPCAEVSVQDQPFAELKIFPNPASDQFQLSDATGIRSIEVSSLNGILLRTFAAADGAKYEISDLMPGLYLLSLKGDNNAALRTLRLSIQ